jgi:hypothetical protein
MTNRPAKRRRWFLLCATITLLAASLISVGVFSAKKQNPKAQRPKDWLTTTPAVMSKVKDLEIVNARVVRAGSDMPGVAFEILNKSHRAVMAVDIMCGESGMLKDGLGDEEHPTVVIEPGGMLEVEMNDELSPGLPIVLSGATFEDGTEEGTETSLKAIHRARKHERERRKAQKEAKPAERGQDQ